MAEGKKGRKVGRHKKSGANLAYIREQRHEKGHYRRILKHLQRYGVSDKAALASLRSYANKLNYFTKVEGDLRNLGA